MAQDPVWVEVWAEVWAEVDLHKVMALHIHKVIHHKEVLEEDLRHRIGTFESLQNRLFQHSAATSSMA